MSQSDGRSWGVLTGVRFTRFVYWLLRCHEDEDDAVLKSIIEAEFPRKGKMQGLIDYRDYSKNFRNSKNKMGKDLPRLDEPLDFALQREYEHFKEISFPLRSRFLDLLIPMHQDSDLLSSHDNPPTQTQYVSVINEIRGELSEASLKALRFQFQSPGRAVTSQELRDCFGYKGIATSNSLYGRLGRQFAETLRMQTESPDSSRTRWWRALSTGDGSGEHFTWIMRPELANALIETGLVDSSLDGSATVPDVDINASSYAEGRKKLRAHLVRERNRALVKAKKDAVNSHACEVCGFDSHAVYGVDYCEVHHLIPLADLDDHTETALDDLAIVCANCHRIIHLQTPPLEIDKLRNQLKK